MEETIKRFQRVMPLIRRINGWTLEEFGDKLKVTKQTISNLENKNKTSITLTQYIAIRSVIEYEMQFSKNKDVLVTMLNMFVDNYDQYTDEERNRLEDKISLIKMPSKGLTSEKIAVDFNKFLFGVPIGFSASNINKNWLHTVLGGGGYRMDENLRFLESLNNEQLGILVEIMLKEGWQSETLSISDEYKKYSKNYSNYVERIEKEYRAFGGNTFKTLITGNSPEYKEILCNVCKKMKINFNKEQKVEFIENNLLEKVLTDVWENLSNAERKKLLDTAQSKYVKKDIEKEGLAALMLAFKAGGFASYQLTMVIVNAVARQLLGRGLTLATNAAINKTLAVLTGTVGIAMMTAFMAYDVAGPAYRVIIPCTILIAAFRKEYNTKEKEW